LKFCSYVRSELRDEVQRLAEQVKFRLEEALDISPELVEKAEIIVHKIRLGLGKAYLLPLSSLLVRPW